MKSDHSRTWDVTNVIPNPPKPRRGIGWWIGGILFLVPGVGSGLFFGVWVGVPVGVRIGRKLAGETGEIIGYVFFTVAILLFCSVVFFAAGSKLGRQIERLLRHS